MLTPDSPFLASTGIDSLDKLTKPDTDTVQTISTFLVLPVGEEIDSVVEKLQDCRRKQMQRILDLQYPEKTKPFPSLVTAGDLEKFKQKQLREQAELQEEKERLLRLVHSFGIYRESIVKQGKMESIELALALSYISRILGNDMHKKDTWIAKTKVLIKTSSPEMTAGKLTALLDTKSGFEGRVNDASLQTPEARSQYMELLRISAFDENQIVPAHMTLEKFEEVRAYLSAIIDFNPQKLTS